MVINDLINFDLKLLQLDNDLILYKYIEQDIMAIYDGIKVKDITKYGICSIGLTEEEFNFYLKNRSSVVNTPKAYFSYKNYYIFELKAFSGWVTYNSRGEASSRFMRALLSDIRDGNCLYIKLFGFLLERAKKL